jgi:sucrose phosphorylase
VLDQLELIRMRNTSPAFDGELSISGNEPHVLKMTWSHPEETLTLKADLRTHEFRVYRENDAGRENLIAPAA